MPPTQNFDHTVKKHKNATKETQYAPAKTSKIILTYAFIIIDVLPVALFNPRSLHRSISPRGSNQVSKENIIKQDHSSQKLETNKSNILDTELVSKHVLEAKKVTPDLQ